MIPDRIRPGTKEHGGKNMTAIAIMNDSKKISMALAQKHLVVAAQGVKVRRILDTWIALFNLVT